MAIQHLRNATPQALACAIVGCSRHLKAFSLTVLRQVNLCKKKHGATYRQHCCQHTGSVVLSLGEATQKYMTARYQRSIVVRALRTAAGKQKGSSTLGSAIESRWIHGGDAGPPALHPLVPGHPKGNRLKLPSRQSPVRRGCAHADMPAS